MPTSAQEFCTLGGAVVLTEDVIGLCDGTSVEGDLSFRAVLCACEDVDR